jgi:hypothetical protein
MNDRITVQEVERLFREHLGSTSISTGDAAYRIENYHPNGMVHVWYVFGGIREFIEEFIPSVKTYPFEGSVRNGIIDKQWTEYTLGELRDNHSMERMIREYLTDSNGRADGQLCRFVVAMLRAGDPWDAMRPVTLTHLRNQRCLVPFKGGIGKIADDLRDRGVIAGEGNGYWLRVLIPLFSREWWEPYRLGW